MKILTERDFLCLAQRTLSKFERQREERRQFSPTQFPLRMTESDWWRALQEFAVEQHHELRADPLPRPAPRLTPAQITRSAVRPLKKA